MLANPPHANPPVVHSVTAGMNEADITAANTITQQAIELLLRYVGRRPEGVALIYVILYNRRMMLIFDLTQLKMFNLPNEYVKHLRAALGERKIVYRPNKRGTCVVMVVSYQPVKANPDLSRLPVLAGFADKQVVVYGPTGSGKTSVLQHLLCQCQGLKIIFDPHYEPGKWHSDDIVIGAGRNWAAIETGLDQLVLEMDRRYQKMQDGESDFSPIHIAVDELSSFARNIPNGSERLITLAQEGRKVKMHTILTPHSTEVTQMGFEGSGDARENFVFIGMPPVLPGQENQPRIATVHAGNPRRKGNDPLGRFLVPAPKVYQGKARLLADLASVLGAAAPVAQAVAGPVAGTGHARATGEKRQLPFEQRYAAGSPDADDLALFVAQHGYGVRKIGELLPYSDHLARQTAAQAISRLNGSRDNRPTPGSSQELAFVKTLYAQWGVPVNRLARLLDGSDHHNLARIQAMIERSA